MNVNVESTARTSARRSSFGSVIPDRKTASASCLMDFPNAESFSYSALNALLAEVCLAMPFLSSRVEDGVVAAPPPPSGSGFLRAAAPLTFLGGGVIASLSFDNFAAGCLNSGDPTAEDFVMLSWDVLYLVEEPFSTGLGRCRSLADSLLNVT